MWASWQYLYNAALFLRQKIFFVTLAIKGMKLIIIYYYGEKEHKMPNYCPILL